MTAEDFTQLGSNKIHKVEPYVFGQRISSKVGTVILELRSELSEGRRIMLKVIMSTEEAQDLVAVTSTTLAAMELELK